MPRYKQPKRKRKADEKVTAPEKRTCAICTEFKFEKTELGTKRTCKKCGHSVTEVGRHVHITKVVDFHPVKSRKGFKQKMEAVNG